MAISGGYAAMAADLERAAVAFGAMTSATLAFGQSLNAFRELEKELVNANTVASGTADQLKAMSEAVRQFSLVTTTGAVNAAAAIYDLASAGFSVKESMQAMTGVLLLSQATLTPASESAKLLASAIRAFSLEAYDAGRVANTFAAAISVSQADMPKLVYAFRQVAPVAQVAKLSIEETTAALSALFNVGLSGEQAGTALRNVIVNLTRPQGQARDVLQVLGISTTDVQGEFGNLFEILRQLAAKNPTADTVEKIFGKEALAGALALMKASTQQLDDLTQRVTGTQFAFRLAQEQLATFDGTVKLATNALTDMGISLGEALAPRVKELAGFLIDLNERFRDLTPAQQQHYVSLAQWTIGIVAGAAALGTMARALQSFASLTGVTFLFNTFIGAAAAGTLALGPFGVAIAGVTAAVAALTLAYLKLSEANPAEVIAKATGEGLLQKGLPSFQSTAAQTAAETQRTDRTFQRGGFGDLDALGALRSEMDKANAAIDAAGKDVTVFKARRDALLKELNAISDDTGITDDLRKAFATGFLGGTDITTAIDLSQAILGPKTNAEALKGALDAVVKQLESQHISPQRIAQIKELLKDGSPILDDFKNIIATVRFNRKGLLGGNLLEPGDIEQLTGVFSPERIKNVISGIDEALKKLGDQSDEEIQKETGNIDVIKTRIQVRAQSFIDYLANNIDLLPNRFIQENKGKLKEQLQGDKGLRDILVNSLVENQTTAAKPLTTKELEDWILGLLQANGVIDPAKLAEATTALRRTMAIVDSKRTELAQALASARTGTAKARADLFHNADDHEDAEISEVRQHLEQQRQGLVNRFQTALKTDLGTNAAYNSPANAEVIKAITGQDFIEKVYDEGTKSFREVEHKLGDNDFQEARRRSFDAFVAALTGGNRPGNQDLIAYLRSKFEGSTRELQEYLQSEALKEAKIHQDIMVLRAQQDLDLIKALNTPVQAQADANRGYAAFYKNFVATDEQLAAEAAAKLAENHEQWKLTKARILRETGVEVSAQDDRAVTDSFQRLFDIQILAATRAQEDFLRNFRDLRARFQIEVSKIIADTAKVQLENTPLAGANTASLAAGFGQIDAVKLANQAEEARISRDKKLIEEFRDRLSPEARDRLSQRRNAYNAPSSQIDLFEEFGKKYGVEPSFLYGLASHESSFDPSALGPKTDNFGKALKERAQGLFQFLPTTFAEKGGDPGKILDARANTEIASKWIAEMQAAGKTREEIIKVFGGFVKADPSAAVADIAKRAQGYGSGYRLTEKDLAILPEELANALAASAQQESKEKGAIPLQQAKSMADAKARLDKLKDDWASFLAQSGFSAAQARLQSDNPDAFKAIDAFRQKQASEFIEKVNEAEHRITTDVLNELGPEGADAAGNLSVKAAEIVKNRLSVRIADIKTEDANAAGQFEQQVRDRVTQFQQIIPRINVEMENVRGAIAQTLYSAGPVNFDVKKALALDQIASDFKTAMLDAETKFNEGIKARGANAQPTDTDYQLRAAREKAAKDARDAKIQETEKSIGQEKQDFELATKRLADELTSTLLNAKISFAKASQFDFGIRDALGKGRIEQDYAEAILQIDEKLAAEAKRRGFVKLPPALEEAMRRQLTDAAKIDRDRALKEHKRELDQLALEYEKQNKDLFNELQRARGTAGEQFAAFQSARSGALANVGSAANDNVLTYVADINQRYDEMVNRAKAAQLAFEKANDADIAGIEARKRGTEELIALYERMRQAELDAATGAEGQARAQKQYIDDVVEGMKRQYTYSGTLWQGLKAGALDAANKTATPFETGFDAVRAGIEDIGQLFDNLISKQPRKWGDMLNDMARQLASSAVRSLLSKLAGVAVSALVGEAGVAAPAAVGGGLPLGSAMGNVFTNGGITQMYADGGVIDGLTQWRGRDGGRYSAGEAGPEAIMPLKRDSSGRLGVAAGGGSGGGSQQAMVVNFHVSTPDADSFRRSSGQIQNQFAMALKNTMRRG